VGEVDYVATTDAEEIALRQKLAMKQFYICFTERTHRDGDPYEGLKPLMKDHLRWIAGLESDGIAFAAGPFRDRNDSTYWNGDGMFILRAESVEDATRIAQTCPFHQAGVRRFRIVPWWLNEGRITISVELTKGRIELG